MKLLLTAVAIVCCVSCSTYVPDLSDTKRFVPIPQSAVAEVQGVQREDGISKDEAQEIGDVFWHKFIRGCGSCGLADLPLNRGEFWRVELIYGPMFIGYDGGNLWILKDGTGVYYEPPRTGICIYGRQQLAHYGVTTNNVQLRVER